MHGLVLSLQIVVVRIDAELSDEHGLGSDVVLEELKQIAECFAAVLIVSVKVDLELTRTDRFGPSKHRFEDFGIGGFDRTS